jgi:CDK inhibitor PHO81
LLFDSYALPPPYRQTLPLTLGVNLEVRYTTSTDAVRHSFNNVIEINAFIDSVLSTVYSSSSSSTSVTTPSPSRSSVPGSFFPLIPDAPSTSPTLTTTTMTTKATPRSNRKIFFTAFDPNIASFLNLKQPNYAVFFASFCGIARARVTEMLGNGGGELKPAGVDEEEDKRCMSVREAVKFAKANNLLGLVLDATLIVRSSSLPLCFHLFHFCPIFLDPIPATIV